MKRLLPLPFAVVLMACPGDKKPQKTAALSVPVDTTAQTTNLSTVKSSVPPAAPDTFRPRKLAHTTVRSSAGELADAPPPLTDVVQREESVSQFCFIEFGKKTDPSLRGNVDMAVSVASAGVSDIRIASSSWSGNAGAAVDNCLIERAKRAWKLAPGSVKPGKYAVRLTFSG